MSDPSPLTPADLDLRSLSYMPLHVERLLISETWLIATGDEAKAAMTLWCRAWHQVPAASLPNDERLLAALSGAGTKWKRVREVALRGYVLCSDGRLYHSLLASEALEALEKRERWRRKKRGQRERHGGGQSGDVPEDMGGDERGDVPEDIGGETALRDGTGRDTDVDRPSPECGLVARETRSPRTKPAKFLLPENWQPSPETVETLVAKGYSHHEIAWQRDRFVNHFAGGEKRPGWDRSFINWVTSDRPGKFSPTVNGQGNRPRGSGIVAGVGRLLDALPDDEPFRA